MFLKIKEEDNLVLNICELEIIILNIKKLLKGKILKKTAFSLE